MFGLFKTKAELKRLQQENDDLKLEIYRLNKKIELLEAHQVLEYNFIIPEKGGLECDFSQNW